MTENSEGNPTATSPSKHEGWLNSWLSAAKNKSTEVLEFVKKDLEEFGSAVKSEASSVVTSVERTLSLESPDSTVNTVKRSFSTFLGQMNTVLNPTPDDEDTEILIIENSETHQLNKFQSALYNLQKNPETYMSDPEPKLRKQYEAWLEILEPEALSDDRVAKYVNSSEVLKKYYAKLVPDILEHQLFWKRYLFKKALLEDDIARQEAQEKRVIDTKPDTNWQREFAENVELTEEQQIALLQQYENEQKSKSSKNGGSSATPSSSACSTDDDWEKIGDLEK